MHRLCCTTPAPALLPFVRSFAQREVDYTNSAWDQVLPARLNEILEFQFDDVYRLSGANDGYMLPPPVALVGLYTKNDCTIHFNSKVTSFAIMFQPSGFSQLFGTPQRELANRAFDAHSLMGKMIQQLHQQLGDCSTFVARTLVAEEFLLTRVAGRQGVQGLIETAAMEILNKSGAVRISELAFNTGLSIRQFERRFLENTGISPKTYARLARFQSALDAKIAAPTRPWIEIAHWLNYHDQMHMVRDFHYFAGRPPEEVLAKVGDARPEAVVQRRAFYHGNQRAKPKGFVHLPSSLFIAKS